MHPSLELPWPCRRQQVVRLTFRKVDVGRSTRENLMGPYIFSDARARVSPSQDRSFPRLLEASDRMRKAVDSSLPTSFWLMSHSERFAAVLLVRAGTRAHRAHRRPRRKEARLVPARETSGREVRFLRPNARGGAGRARWPPWQRSNARASRRVLVKWKILEGN